MLRRKGNKRRGAVLVLLLLSAAALLALLKPIFRREEAPPEKPAIETVRSPEPAQPTKPVVPLTPKPRIAVIIDDVGYPSENFEHFSRFQGKLTFSVLPFLDESNTYAQILHRRGFEVMLHIPMEPLDYPEKNPGKGALFADDSREEIEKKIDAMIDELPFSAGTNNHMGSRLTQNYELMTWILTRTKRHNLYFVDSLTTTGSRAYEAATDLQLKTAKRDVFLDNEDNFSYINTQFETLKRLAKQRGTAVGIGHIHSKNLPEVLSHQLPLLQEENIELVFVSEVVRN